MSEELKPCPFCGGTDFITAGGYADYCRWELRCQHCHNRFNGGYDGFKTEQEMIIAWNARTDTETDHLQQENERLKELLRLAVEDMKIAKPCCICKNKDLCYGNCFSYDGFKWQQAERID